MFDVVVKGRLELVKQVNVVLVARSVVFVFLCAYHCFTSNHSLSVTNTNDYGMS